MAWPRFGTTGLSTDLCFVAPARTTDILNVISHKTFINFLLMYFNDIYHISLSSQLVQVVGWAWVAVCASHPPVYIVLYNVGGEGGTLLAAPAQSS